MAPVRPTRAEINLRAIRTNAERLAAVAGVPLWAIVKADAYGHGAAHVSRALTASPVVRGLGVSLIEEGLELRARGIEAAILVMGPSLAGGEREMVEARLTPVISELGDLERFAAIGREREAPLEVQLKLESGMNRIGLQPGELERAIEIAVGKGISISGLMTHLACADEDDPDDPDSQTSRQLIRFATAGAVLRRRSSTVLETHAAATSGLIKFPGSRLSAVRPGLGVYGNGLAATLDGVAVAMNVVTQVAQVRAVPTGEPVSYGALWRAHRDSKVAVLPIGYGDGYPRNLTSRASVLIGGHRFPVIGRVCMDMVMVDVTDAESAVGVGDEVILLGGEGVNHIPASELAAHAQISEYEVTCGISKRVPRVYR